MRLICESLTLFRGERLVVRNFSAAVARGGALVLVGPNGVGKTSILRAIAGLLRPQGGRVMLDGCADYAGKAALLGHLDGLKPGWSAAENLGFSAAIGVGPRSAAGARLAIEKALDQVGLAALEAVPVRYFSAGQKRRLALGRMLLMDAPLWVLDEPSVGLDEDGVAALGEAIAAHRRQGGVVVAATHVTLPLEDAQTAML